MERRCLGRRRLERRRLGIRSVGRRSLERCRLGDAAWSDAAWADSADGDLSLTPASTNASWLDIRQAEAALGIVSPDCDPILSTCSSATGNP